MKKQIISFGSIFIVIPCVFMLPICIICLVLVLQDSTSVSIGNIVVCVILILIIGSLLYSSLNHKIIINSENATLIYTEFIRKTKINLHEIKSITVDDLRHMYHFCFIIITMRDQKKYKMSGCTRFFFSSVKITQKKVDHVNKIISEILTSCH